MERKIIIRGISELTERLTNLKSTLENITDEQLQKAIINDTLVFSTLVDIDMLNRGLANYKTKSDGNRQGDGI
jgi:hypothetical protein